MGRQPPSCRPDAGLSAHEDAEGRLGSVPSWTRPRSDDRSQDARRARPSATEARRRQSVPPNSHDATERGVERRSHDRANRRRVLDALASVGSPAALALLLVGCTRRGPLLQAGHWRGRVQGAASVCGHPCVSRPRRPKHWDRTEVHHHRSGTRRTPPPMRWKSRTLSIVPSGVALRTTIASPASRRWLD